ncbi:ribosomal-protein-alanine N-acetyltransferase [Hydrococcus rivularis NIES-593]|uniref:Ribosomal-protein-alanine N-acetyltransferase n=1 Tax=Hydrococcus rivularis NIES-593 TaxID=1921803 RepID=A0A1U7HDQ5_9CYAN|nr:ribosomal protein S18-alanine N-acetyltransferase [Hydrococcus rivularis]OKH21699.1 ribosomal-protein-alanine N-acetyltransferase [Hydrococcus rivularis NIES-593]
MELKLKPPQTEQLTQVLELDRLCLGGLWTLEGYQRELASPNSSLIALSVLDRARQEDKTLLSSHPLASLSPRLPASSSSPSSVSTIASEESIIGFGCFWAILEEAHITLLMIHPDYQRQGLGQLLLYALLKDACKRKLERATLEVRVSNQVAIFLYKKFGFKVAGRRKNYYQKTGEDALILWRGNLHRPEFSKELEIWHERVGARLAQNHWTLKEET